MKQQRLRFKLLALILFGLFGLLAAFGLYSIDAYGNRWFSYSRNPHLLGQKQDVIPGSIFDRNGVLLATSQPTETGSIRLYQEDEASRRAVVHLLSDPKENVHKGAEVFLARYLYGYDATIPELLSVRLSGQPRVGDHLTLTVDSQLCTEITLYFAAHELTAGKSGAAVVLNYKTGEILAMVSLPTFDPMSSELPSSGSSCYYNRAAHSLYPPGSTFKIITAAAALDNLTGAAEATYTCTGDLTVDQQIIHDYGSAVHGNQTLRNAFIKSCNNIFAQLAQTMGDATLQRTARNFGFDDDFLFRDIIVENSSYITAKTPDANGVVSNRTAFEAVTSGFGQGTIAATPMHMCMVAAGVANQGLIMEPMLLSSVTSGVNGSVRELFTSREYRRALSPQTASILQDYMRAVVTQGTGTRAGVTGLTICGKTGSAQTEDRGRSVTHGWFIGYCADEEVPYAVSILVEDIPDGEGGGSSAAPIAADIFTYLRDHHSRTAE